MTNKQTEGGNERQTVSVGQQLRQLRKAAGLRQEDIAERAGLDRTTIIRAEQGEVVTSDTLVRFVQALGLPTAHLGTGSVNGNDDDYARCCGYVRALPPEAVTALLHHLLHEWHPQFFGRGGNAVDVRNGR